MSLHPCITTHPHPRSLSTQTHTRNLVSGRLSAFGAFAEGQGLRRTQAVSTHQSWAVLTSFLLEATLHQALGTIGHSSEIGDFFFFSTLAEPSAWSGLPMAS